LFEIKLLVGFEMASTLGEELARLRQVKGRTLSLREVERQTGISNEYLSQLERGVATKPAPDVLQKLAKFYGAPYEALLIAAGYLKEKSPTGIAVCFLATLKLSQKPPSFQARNGKRCGIL
jgi:transcriptional regulator with XRE-family HTH domain